jgi:hypothetical protein
VGVGGGCQSTHIAELQAGHASHPSLHVITELASSENWPEAASSGHYLKRRIWVAMHSIRLPCVQAHASARCIARSVPIMNH